MAEYFAENPQIIVNGFAQAGILGALGGYRDEQDEESAMEYETDSEVIELTDEEHVIINNCSYMNYCKLYI